MHIYLHFTDDQFSSQCPTENVSFHSNPKESSNYHTIALILHAKILQARLQQYVNHELPAVQAGFRKGRGTRDQMWTPIGSPKKQEKSRKASTSASFTTQKPLIVWIQTNCRKFWKRWEYQTTWPASWEMCMQVKKQLLELDMEQQIGYKLGKELIKAVYCHPAYLTHMQSTSCEMLGWMKHKLESRLPGEISVNSDM